MATEIQPRTLEADNSEALINAQLKRTRSQVKGVEFGQRVLKLIVGVLAFFLFATLVDHWVVREGLPIWGRVILWLSLICGIIWYTIKSLLPLLLYRVNPLYAARTIEETKPSLKNSLINYLTLRSEQDRLPTVIYDAIAKQAASGVKDASVDHAVDHAPLIRWGYLLLGLTFCFALYFVISPKNPFRTVARVVVPWADLTAPSRVQIVEVTPGSTQLYRGNTVKVAARIEGLSEDETATLHYTTADGQQREQPIKLKLDELRNYTTLLPAPAEKQPGIAAAPRELAGLQQDFEYYITAGDARSNTFRVQVAPAPYIGVERIDYKYPAYTKRPAETRQGEVDVQALEGTTVTIHGTANQPLKKAWIELRDPAGKLAKFPDMKITDQTTSGSWVLGWKDPATRELPDFTSYALRFHNQQGRENPEPIAYGVKVIRDEPPTVDILAPSSAEITVPWDQPIAFEVRAQDPDYALIEVQLVGMRGEKNVFKELIASFAAANAFQGNLQKKHTITPQRLGLQVGDVIEYHVTATDNKVPNPNVTLTTPRKLRVIEAQKNRNNNEPLADKRQQQPNKNDPQDNNGERNQDRPPQAGDQNQQNDKNQNPPSMGNQGQPNDQNNKGQGNQQQATDPTARPQEQNDQQQNPNERQQPQANPNKGQQNENNQDSKQQQPQSPNDTKQQQNNGEAGKAGSQQNNSNPSKPNDASQGNKPGEPQNNSSPQDGKQQNSPMNGGGQSEPQKGQQGNDQNNAKQDQNGNQKPQAGDQNSKPEQNQQANGRPQENENKLKSDGSEDGDVLQRLKDVFDKKSKQNPNDQQASNPPPQDQNNNGKQDQGKQEQGNPNESGKPQDGKQESGKEPNGKQSGKQEQGKEEAGKQSGKEGGKQSGEASASKDKNQQNSGNNKSGENNKQDSGNKESGNEASSSDTKQPTDNKNNGQQKPNDAKQSDQKQTGEQSPNAAGQKPDPTKPQEKQSGQGDQSGEKQAGQTGASEKSDQGPKAEQGKQSDQNGNKSSDMNEQGKRENQEQKLPGANDKKPNPQESKDGNGTEPESKQHPKNDQQQSGAGGNPNGSPKPQETGKPNPNPSSSNTNKNDDQNKEQSPSNKGNDSASKGEDGGDRNGGGSKGGGQQENKQGRGASGSNTEDDMGANAGKQKGDGETGTKAGNQQKSDGKTGNSGNEAGNGTEKKQGDGKQAGGEAGKNTPDGKSEEAGKKPGEPGGKPSPQAGAPKEGQGKEGTPGTTPGRGGGKSEGAGVPPEYNGPHATSREDAVNDAYAKKATDLVLEQLGKQLRSGNVDPELKKATGMNEQELREVHDRWQERMRAAEQPGPTGEAAANKLREQLRSLGLRPQQSSNAGDSTADDTQRGNRVNRRSAPPSEYRDIYRAFQKGASGG